MLQRILARNFKLHKNIDMELPPITLLVGPNNSGKSSLFQVLQLAKQSSITRGGLFLVPHEGHSVDVGAFRDVCTKGEDTLTLTLEGFIAPANLSMIKRKIRRADVSLTGQFQNNDLIYHSGEIAAGEYSVKWEWDKYSKGKITSDSLQIDGFTIKFDAKEEFYSPVSPSISGAPPGTPIEARAEIRNFIDGLVSAPSDLISSVHFVYGLRGFEQFSYLLDRSSPTRMELVLLHDRSSAMANLIAYNRELEERLSEWFETILGVGLRFELLENQKIALEAKKKGITSLVNEGLGLHQLLFILIPIALSQPFETICIDDPGAHLHPRAQSDLVSLLLRIYREEKKQYIITTHSEHILFAFLTALAKKEITKEEIALYYFENRNGTADVRRVELDEHGRISGGLPGFFEHNIEKMLDYLDSLEQ